MFRTIFRRFSADLMGHSLPGGHSSFQWNSCTIICIFVAFFLFCCIFVAFFFIFLHLLCILFFSLIDCDFASHCYVSFFLEHMQNTFLIVNGSFVGSFLIASWTMTLVPSNGEDDCSAVKKLALFWKESPFLSSITLAEDLLNVPNNFSSHTTKEIWFRHSSQVNPDNW